MGWAAYDYVGTPNVDPTGDIALDLVLPIVQATLLLQLLHEAGHLVAALYHRLELGAPFLIPSAILGLGGGHAPLASFPKNRTQLYDFAMAGPLAGGAASAAMFAAGLYLTATATAAETALFPLLPTSTLHCSLVGSLAVELSLGTPSATAENAATYALHPLALSGFSGVVANALALLPIGRLDGGRAATAAYGRRTAAAIGALALLLLAVASAASEAPNLLLLWAAISVALFRQAEVPCTDEISEIEPARSRALLPLLLLAALVLCPLPAADTDGGAGFDELARMAADSGELFN